MGKRDSSKTRVVPVFDLIAEGQTSGASWLPKLLCLPIGSSKIVINPDWDLTIEERGWGEKEKRLDPPVSLLSWLIRNPRMPNDGQLSNDPVKAQKRRELIEGSDVRLHEVLNLLRHNPTKENWHIFEGITQPDVFIQTPDIMIVVEGKRTETETTKKTKWMSGRHQMWRHIDCAWEIKGKREVFGLLIVEGDPASDKVPTFWMNEARIIASREALTSSLPHRGQQETESIHQCFLGVTTWQKICKEFGIEWGLLPDLEEE